MAGGLTVAPKVGRPGCRVGAPVGDAVTPTVGRIDGFTDGGGGLSLTTGIGTAMGTG